MKSSTTVLNWRAVEVREHPLGDIVAIVPESSVLLTYFRNNVAHLVAVPSLVASCFLNRHAIGTEQLRHIALAIYPFLKVRAVPALGEDEFLQAVDDHIAGCSQRTAFAERRMVISWSGPNGRRKRTAIARYGALAVADI